MLIATKQAETCSTEIQSLQLTLLDAVALVERLGLLPFALVFAGSYIAKTTVVKYTELYNTSWAKLHETMKARNDYHHSEQTILTTWQIPFDEVERKDKKAAKLLRLWGYLSNHELWYELLLWPECRGAAPNWLQQITTTDFSFLETIGTLLNYSLIERNGNTETYSMHAVVHDWIQASNDVRGDATVLQTALTTIGLAVPPQMIRDSSTIQRRLQPHLLHLLQYWSHTTDQENNVVHLRSLVMLGILCVDLCKFVEAEQMYQRALQSREKALGADHTSTLNTANNLGLLYADQGKLAEAEEMYQRALQGYEKALGADHTSTLNTVNNLGLLYADQGKLAEAEEMYQRALKGRKKALGA